MHWGRFRIQTVLQSPLLYLVSCVSRKRAACYFGYVKNRYDKKDIVLIHFSTRSSAG